MAIYYISRKSRDSLLKHTQVLFISETKALQGFINVSHYLYTNSFFCHLHLVKTLSGKKQASISGRYYQSLSHLA